MKKLLAVSAIIAGCVGAWAQGSVNFSNLPFGANALVTDGLGNKLGTAYLAQLYAGAAESSLAPVGAAVAFRNNSAGVATGLFSGGERVTSLPVAGGGVFQVRAWEAALGNSYDVALAAGNGLKVGKSSVFAIGTLGDSLAQPPGTPVNLTGLTSFSLVAIPEPSTVALGLLGAVSLLAFRRK